MRFFSILLFFFLIKPVISHSASLVNVKKGYGSVPYQKASERMSCRHMRLRNESLTHFSDWLLKLHKPATDYRHFQEFRSYLNSRNQYSISDLRKERTYRISYPVFDAELIRVIDQSEHVVFSNGFDLDSRDPNGGFSFSGLKVEQSGDSRVLSFDISGVESCFSKKAEVIFFTQCPIEKIRFDTCEYQNGECIGKPYWESEPFVVDWWNCGQKQVFEFDFESIFK